MRITGIHIYQCDVPLKFAFHSPQAFRSRAESVLVEVEFDNGVSGYGESAPRNYVTGETCSSVIGILRKEFTGLLLEKCIERVEDIDDLLRRLEHCCIDNGIPAYHSALGAIDIALLDALGKVQHKPIYEFLGPAVRTEIPHAVPIPFLPPEKIKRSLSILKDIRFKSVKVLMGQDEEENRQRVSWIRKLFGSEMDIRVEANGKWTPDQAISNLRKIENFRISAVEQPVPRGDCEGMRKVRSTLGISVIADESMYSLSDARDLIECGCCDILNIKISKCGGLLRSKQIADYARQKGVLCQLGSHVGEADVLSAAGVQFAMVLSNLTYFEGPSNLLLGKFRKDGRLIKENERARGPLHGLGVAVRGDMLTKICSLGVDRHEEYT
ncbi:MAG: mandelate racemase/muconate lactonizing enzyme family protein [Syntrophales bacterium]